MVVTRDHSLAPPSTSLRGSMIMVDSAPQGQESRMMSLKGALISVEQSTVSEIPQRGQ